MSCSIHVIYLTVAPDVSLSAVVRATYQRDIGDLLDFFY